MDSISTENRVILFCDVHDFSKVCLELGDGCPLLIQDYYVRVGESIVSYGGQIVKYMGDAILAVFNPGRELDAVESATGMREEYSLVLKKYSVETDSDLEVGIGSGEVVTGTFGHPSLRVMDVFGTKVNEVAMIMHHRGIAITKDVLQKLGSLYKTQRLANVTVKWSTSPLEVWEIVHRQNLRDGA